MVTGLAILFIILWGRGAGLDLVLENMFRCLPVVFDAEGLKSGYGRMDSLALVATGYEDADVGLGFDILEDFGPGEVIRFLDTEGGDERFLRVSGGDFFPDGLRGVVLDFFAGGGIETFGDVAEL